ncbi:N-acetylgalactosamine-6-sulfatase [Streptomyces sp. WAC 06738]|uniref:arylsulfatase n=1 Tax=Streptomyces sp. WAC 06738 TaxID=2203210 RepID=UPI000F716795|nr:arylsulfatase [Streptomyces sp. WAC 06738]AZM48702.1 N-acetylgalactosamine-6-sulfatase [Streptomyces sp. WAC 06738]
MTHGSAFPSRPGFSRRGFLGGVAALSLAGAGAVPGRAVAGTGQHGGGRRPNIVLIVLDDLGRGELGCYGQRRIRTPVLDGLAAEGIRFTDAYANPSCAPTRASLLTGLHTGHASVKSNADAATGLAATDLTVAEVLRSAGYTTGLVGKWGLGPETGGNPSHPNSQGFDSFFGHIDQRHAHDYWPTYLWRDGERVSYPENDGADVTYTTDLFTRETLEFLDRSRDEPFFLHLNYTTPHAPNEIPDDAPYTHEDWPEGERNHAAQITYTDGEIGKVLARLAELGLADDTLVLVTSDNGPHAAGHNMGHVGSTLPHDPEFFDSNGPLRGIKFTVYEGGIRVPLIVRLPAALRTARGPAPGSVLHDPVAVWDHLPTLAEVGGAAAPEGLDGVSFVPALTGRRQTRHPYLYWEADGADEAVRFGRWKGVRPEDGPVELYDLRADPGEQSDVAAARPELVRTAERLLADAVAER